MSEQAALLTALWGPAPPTNSPGLRRLPAVAVAEGLRVYRENAKALAVRALGAAYPRLSAWLGADDFAGLAWAYARANPPRQGDAATWGEAMPEHLAALPGMPSVGPDLARLDWALHCLAFAADTDPAQATLWEVLQSTPPERVRLKLSPHVAALHLSSLADDGAWKHAQQGGAAVDDDPGAHVVVWRQGWQPCWSAMPPDAALWLGALHDGVVLADALDATLTQYPAFDLGAWLALAWQRHWLLGADAL